MSTIRTVEIPWDDEPVKRKLQYSDPPDPKPPGMVRFNSADTRIHVTTLYAARRRGIVTSGRIDPLPNGGWWSWELGLGGFLLDLGIPFDVIVDSLRQERLSRGMKVRDKKKP